MPLERMRGRRSSSSITLVEAKAVQVDARERSEFQLASEAKETLCAGSTQSHGRLRAHALHERDSSVSAASLCAS